ncbi:MAG: LytTR family DNA-binding domain-containing protein [Oscillospiraceae bacterium]|nr:LytTR family DNA-binding domain-containing protein [Oscillospiraceae bacterium]
MENVNYIISGHETRKVLTTMVKFAVCDDDKKMHDSISDKLREYYPDECEIKTYTDGARLLSECRWSCFDALFLDIDMPESNGMEIAENIREIDRRVKIIFVSDKNKLAYKGYLYNAFRFVRKSNLEQDLCEAVKGLNESFSTQSDYLVFKTSRGEAVRSVEDIKYFEIKTHFINVVCNDGDIRIYGTLREYEEQIGNNGFIRIHKSYLVNFRYIRSVEKNIVFLSCGKELPLSRYRANETKMKMMFFSRNLVM